jgi:hypothetical protein
MKDRVLFEFEGVEVVRQFSLYRSSRGHELVLTLATGDDRRSLRLINPRPVARLYGIVDAEQVWVSIDPDPAGESGGVKVEFWHGGFGQFTADAVIELESPAYETSQDRPLGDMVEPPDPRHAETRPETPQPAVTQPATTQPVPLPDGPADEAPATDTTVPVPVPFPEDLP